MDGRDAGARLLLPGHVGVGHGVGVLDEALHAAQGHRELHEVNTVEHGERLVLAAVDEEGDDAARAGALLAVQRDLLLAHAGLAGVRHGLDPGVAVQELHHLAGRSPAAAPCGSAGSRASAG